MVGFWVIVGCVVGWLQARLAGLGGLVIFGSGVNLL